MHRGIRINEVARFTFSKGGVQLGLLVKPLAAQERLFKSSAALIVAAGQAQLAEPSSHFLHPTDDSTDSRSPLICP